MVDPTALGGVAAERVEAALPDRHVTSLRDIEVLYGELYSLAKAGSGTYAKYLTPDAADDLRGTDESVLVVYLDLRGETPQLGDVTPVDAYAYRDDLVPLLAHSKYASARGVDHSLTHQSGRDNSPEKLATHATDRFTRWPTEDAIRETAKEHDDGWLIDVLTDLGEDDEMMESVESATENAISDDRTMLVTVAIALDPDEETVATTEAFNPDAEYHYPGEFEVFQEAMAARKTRKFKAKNAAKDAVGEGVCFVTDAEESVYGVVDDPMKSYLSKQAEKFPRFDSDESWRTQPLSRDAAIAAQNAETFLDACEYSGARGASVYYLPYLSGKNALDPREGKWLFRTLAELTEDDESDGDWTALERAYETYEGTKELLRYAIFVVHKYQKDRWRLIAGSTNVSAVETAKLANTHRQILDGPSFAQAGAFPTDEDWPLLNPKLGQPTLVGLVSRPEYFFRTCAETDEDDPSADDLRFRATVAAISSGSIPIEPLLESYVERIDQWSDSSDGRFPDRLVASQYAQLAALAEHGVLDAGGETTESLETPPETAMNDESDGTERSRTEKLDDFIDRHPALAGEENYERRGVFLLGALVGRVSRYQAQNGKSMTAIKSNPVDGLTKHNIKRIAKEVVRQNIVYSDEEGYSGTMYAELMNGVADDLQRRNPDDWNLNTEDLRFHYALGIAYGQNDQTTLNYESNNDD